MTDNNIIRQKEQGFTLSLKDTILEKPQGEKGMGVKLYKHFKANKH